MHGYSGFQGFYGYSGGGYSGCCCNHEYGDLSLYNETNEPFEVTCKKCGSPIMAERVADSLSGTIKTVAADMERWRRNNLKS